MTRHSIFDFLAKLPAETYADQMVLNGFVEATPEEQAQAPWVAYGLNEWHIAVELDYMEAFAARAFKKFGGTAVSRVLEFSGEKLYEYFNDYENQDRFGVYAYTDILAPAVCRFLSGQRTDEECANLMLWNR